MINSEFISKDDFQKLLLFIEQKKRQYNLSIPEEFKVNLKTIRTISYINEQNKKQVITIKPSEDINFNIVTYYENDVRKFTIKV